MAQLGSKSKVVKYNQAYSTFVDGQNSASAPDNLRDSEVKLAVNFDVISRGSLRVRHGTIACLFPCLTADGVISSSRITRAMEFSLIDGTLIKLFLIDGKLYRSDSVTPLLTDIGEHVDYAVYNNKLYMLMKNSYYVYDGTTLAEVANTQTDSQLDTIKKCKYIEVRADRVYVSGNPEAPNALYYSQVGDPTYFKSGQHVVNAPSSDGDIITGLKEFSNAMLVFKANGIWAWTGYSVTDDIQFNRLNTHTGTRHYRTIQLVNSYLYFLGIDGLYMLKTTYSGALVTEKISMPVDDLFEHVAVKANAYENTGVAIFHLGKYYLAFSDATTSSTGLNNTVVVAHVSDSDSTQAGFTVYTGVNFSDVLRSGDDKVYFTSAAGNAVFRFSEEAYSDRGAAIDFMLESKDYDMGSSLHIKKFIKAYIWVNQDLISESIMDIGVKVDYATVEFEEINTGESMVWTSDTFDFHKWGWINTVTRALKLSKKGVRACILISGSSTDAIKNRVFIYGMGFTYKIKKLYKDY